MGSGIFSSCPSYDVGQGVSIKIIAFVDRIILNESLYNYALNEFLAAPRNTVNDRYRKDQGKYIISIF